MNSPYNNAVFEGVISKNTFVLPTEGSMRFPIGVIFPQPKDIDEDHEYTFMLCKVAVGRSMCIKSNEEIPKSRAELPAGYDSVYVIDAGAAYRDETTPEGGRLYRHEYVVYNSQQVLPCYLVICKFEFEGELGKEICAKCSGPADKYCEEDGVCLCTDCDLLIHDSNEEFARIFRKHNRIPLSEKNATFGDCKDHSRKIEFFCDTCQQPLCVFCKMQGNHASGEYANHAIVPIMQAYQNAKSDAKNEDPTLKKKKSIIQSYINKTQNNIAYSRV